MEIFGFDSCDGQGKDGAIWHAAPGDLAKADAVALQEERQRQESAEQSAMTPHRAPSYAWPQDGWSWLASLLNPPFGQGCQHGGVSLPLPAIAAGAASQAKRFAVARQALLA